MYFDVENECIRKKNQECHTKDFFFYQEHKRNLFFEKISWMLIFYNTSNANLLDVFSGDQSSPFPPKKFNS
jgi:hypothetical protein